MRCYIVGEQVTGLLLLLLLLLLLISKYIVFCYGKGDRSVIAGRYKDFFLRQRSSLTGHRNLHP